MLNCLLFFCIPAPLIHSLECKLHRSRDFVGDVPAVPGAVLGTMQVCSKYLWNEQTLSEASSISAENGMMGIGTEEGAEIRPNKGVQASGPVGNKPTKIRSPGPV